MGGITRLLLLLWVGVTVSTVVDLQKRIIGGQPCGPNERLYHVKLIAHNKTHESLCGGSLISDQWILTAQHCWEEGWTMDAILSVHPGGKQTTEQIIDHKTFTEKDNNNNDIIHDIMLVKLSRPTSIQHVQLPNCGKRPKKGDTVQVAGYGSRDPEKTINTLQCVNITVVDCPWVKNPLQNINPRPNDHRFCAQSPGVDTCPGDSGGGVVYRQMIYGVHSSSGVAACTRSAEFMNVCEYMKWIKKIIAKPNPIVKAFKACFGCG